MSFKKQIEVKSLIERILLNDLISNDDSIDKILFTSYSGNDKFDAIYELSGKTSIAEVKVRNYSIKDYEAWFLEKNKYDYLIQQKHFKNHFYINFFKDGVIIYNLSEIDFTNIPVLIQKLRINNSGFDTKNKEVYLLPVNSCFKIQQYYIDYVEIKQKAENIWEKRNK